MERIIFKGKINDLTAFLEKATEQYKYLTLADYIWLMGLQKRFIDKRGEDDEKIITG